MKAYLILSGSLGLLFGAAVHWLLGHSSGLIPAFSGMGFGALLFLFLILHQRYMDRRYAAIESQLSSPVFHRANGNFDLGNGQVKSGRIYFCDNGIVCVSLDGKPYALEVIPVENLSRIRFDSIRLHIYTKDDRLFCITLPQAEEIADMLIRRDWME